MQNLKQPWVFALIVVMLSLGVYLFQEKQAEARRQAPAPEFSQRPGSISTMPLFSLANSPVPKP